MKMMMKYHHRAVVPLGISLVVLQCKFHFAILRWNYVACQNFLRLRGSLLGRTLVKQPPDRQE